MNGAEAGATAVAVAGGAAALRGVPNMKGAAGLAGAAAAAEPASASRGKVSGIFAGPAESAAASSSSRSRFFLSLLVDAAEDDRAPRMTKEIHTAEKLD